MRFEIFFSNRDNKFYYRLKAANGQIMATGGGYSTKGAAKAAIAEFVDGGDDEARYGKEVARDGRHFFEVSDGAGNQIARSGFYASASSASKAAERIRESVPVAEVTDISQVPLAAPQTDVLFDVDQTTLPPEVLRDYVKSLEAVLVHVKFRDDTSAGRAYAKFASRIDASLVGGAPTDDDGFDCAGSVGTFGTYACAGTVGGTAGTAGSVGTAGSFGCADPDNISLCWGKGDDDEDQSG